MGVISHKLVTLSDVASTREFRLDSHFHLLSDVVADLTAGMKQPVALGGKHFPNINNGKNIPRAAYDISLEDPDYVYVSVSGLSQFSLQVERCTPLRSPDTYHYDFSLSGSAFSATEVLVTRSGTPGIAWASVGDRQGPQLIPSGFVIRIECAGSGFDPRYVASMLNHPAWRMWSSSLAAGKRQRNLSQEHLLQIRLPLVSEGLQDKIAVEYERLHSTIEALLQEETDICAIADAVLIAATSIPITKLSLSQLTFDKVSLAECAKSSVLRMDGRFHRSDVQGALTILHKMECIRLGSLLIGESIIKN